MTNTENTKGQNSCTAMIVAGIALFSSSVALSGDRSTPVTAALDLHLSRVVDNVIYSSGIIDCVLTAGIATQCYTLVAQRDGLSPNWSMSCTFYLPEASTLLIALLLLSVIVWLFLIERLETRIEESLIKRHAVSVSNDTIMSDEDRAVVRKFRLGLPVRDEGER